MLKRNLVRTGIFSHGLLLLLPNATAVKGEPITHSWEVRPGKLLHQSWNEMDSTARPATVSTTSGFASGAATAKTKMAAPQINLNRNAVKFVNSFMKNEDESLRQIKGRSKSYFGLIDDIFNRYDLPQELKYLAVVESELRTTAVSKVGAKGMWQLMPQTARDLGLKVGKKYDERTQVYKSTVAAAKYLRDLYSEFGDWLLVIAAYNGGPGTVYKAIYRSGSRNFWVLQNYLPMESRAHVKRFIGAHYYFEGTGSLTTLTKSETQAYMKALASYREQQVAPEAANTAAMATMSR